MSRRSRSTMLLNAPYTLWTLIFILVPLLIVSYYALTNNQGGFTLSNIGALKDYLPTFLHSAWYSLIATVITLVISYPLSYYISRRGTKRQLLLTLLILPMWINLLICTYAWMNILEFNGLINQLLGLVGLGPITMIGTAGAVILGMVYNYLPYMLLPIYTVMSKIDTSLLEAAEDLGADSWQRLRRVILPLSRPGVISGIIMVFVPSISTFYISQKLGGGKIIMVGDVIERQIQTNYNYNLGAALSLVLMIFVLLSIVLLNRVSSGDTGNMEGRGLFL